jgi:hypothetical protein
VSKKHTLTFFRTASDISAQMRTAPDYPTLKCTPIGIPRKGYNLMFARKKITTLWSLVKKVTASECSKLYTTFDFIFFRTAQSSHKKLVLGLKGCIK